MGILYQIRPIFFTYYQWRRQFRGWKRKLAYRPGLTYHRELKVRTFKKMVIWVVLWHMLGYYIYIQFFYEEIPGQDEIEKRRNMYDYTPWELWKRHKERKFNEEASEGLIYSSQIHRHYGVSGRSTKKSLKLTKANYPYDDY